MAINNDILAKKLAKPRRQPRQSPIVSEDGATHYRVFDEPCEDKIEEQDCSPKEAIPSETFSQELKAPAAVERKEAVVKKVDPADKTPFEPKELRPWNLVEHLNDQDNEQAAHSAATPTEAQKEEIILVSSKSNLSGEALRHSELKNFLDLELMTSGISSEILAYFMRNVVDEELGTTCPIVLDVMQKETSLNATSIRKAIQRIEKRGIIERHRVKNGRGGWTQYKICNYKSLLNTCKLKT